MDGSTPKTAFVLAGGGSLGAVEVGMLQTLVERGISADVVVGASIGAVNGAYFAAFPDAEGVRRLGRIWRGLSWRDVFPFAPFGSLLSFFSLRNYLVSPTPLRRLLKRHLPYRDLRKSAIPMHVVATDILTGTEVVLSSGPVVEAVLASAAVPAVFPPVKLEGRYLADGGIANNTPISVAVALGADRIIVLPTGLSCDVPEPPRTPMNMALHAMGLLITRQLITDIELFSDSVALRVIPPLCPLETTPADFSRASELIERAAKATSEWLEDGGLDTPAIPDHMRPHSHTRDALAGDSASNDSQHKAG